MTIAKYRMVKSLMSYETFRPAYDSENVVLWPKPIGAFSSSAQGGANEDSDSLTPAAAFAPRQAPTYLPIAMPPGLLNPERVWRGLTSLSAVAGNCRTAPAPLLKP